MLGGLKTFFLEGGVPPAQSEAWKSSSAQNNHKVLPDPSCTIIQSTIHQEKNALADFSSAVNLFKTGFLFGVFVDAFKVGS